MPSRRQLARMAFILVVGIGPPTSFYVAHYLGVGKATDVVATGFLQYDLAYYAANGREIFERGNGFGYPNPYDNDIASPVIYYHWLPWLLGVLMRSTGLDPGALQLFLGAIGAIACSIVTYKMVEMRIGSAARTKVGFVLAMWGGGLLTLLFVMGSVITGNGGEVLGSDLAEDWWCLNWGRNLVFPTEAVYHALMAGAWLAAMRGRRFVALACAAALAGTHPFSGVQIIGILSVWIAWEWLRGDSRDWRVPATLALIGMMFAWYYGVFLQSFRAHRHIQEVWSLEWTTPLSVLIPANAIVGIFAVAMLLKREVRARADVQFLCIAFLVSLAFAKHDLFIRAIQPMHFTRGYQWLPLFLIGAPLLVQTIVGATKACRPIASTGLAVGLVVLLLFDNTMFFSRRWLRAGGDLYLTRSEEQVFDYLESHDIRGVFVASDHLSSFLAATYSPVIPYDGHEWLTPNYRERRAAVDSWTGRNGPEAFLSDVQYVMLWTRQSYLLDGRPDWRVEYRTTDHVLFVRTGSAP